LVLVLNFNVEVVSYVFPTIADDLNVQNETMDEDPHGEGVDVNDESQLEHPGMVLSCFYVECIVCDWSFLLLHEGLRHSNDHPNNGNADGFGIAGMICVLVLVVAFFTWLLLTLNIGTDIAEQFPSPFLAEAGYPGLQTPDYESLGNSILNSFVGTYVLLMWNMFIGVNKASTKELERSAHVGTYERRSSYCHEHVGGSSALRVPDRHYHAMEFPTEYGKCYSCVLVNMSLIMCFM
jgi:hypothetical protein